MLIDEIVFYLIAGEAFGNQPCGVAQPEERRAILMDEITMVVGYFETAIVPRFGSLGCRDAAAY
jgi:hypothetical protein